MISPVLLSRNYDGGQSGGMGVVDTISEESAAQQASLAKTVPQKLADS